MRTRKNHPKRFAALPLLIILLLASGSLAAPLETAPSEAPLEDILHQAMQGGRYARPSAEEIGQAEELFFKLFTGKEEERERQKEAWKKLGWQFLPAQVGSHQAIILQEKAKQKTGRGFFVILQGQGLTQQVLMMPHGFKDLFTDDIGVALLQEGHFRGGAFNTRPRWKKRKGLKIEQDLAREPISYFTSFARAFARSAPQGRVIQLHGFAQEKRISAAGRKADFILSNGTKNTPQYVRSLSTCLGQSLNLSSLTYPDQVDELNGAINISGKILRTMDYKGFLQMEMSRPIRERLTKDAQVRKKLLLCTKARN